MNGNLSWSPAIHSESCCEWIATKSDGHFHYIWANRPQTTFQNCRKFQILFCLVENNLEESFLSSFSFQTQHHHNQTQKQGLPKKSHLKNVLVRNVLSGRKSTRLYFFIYFYRYLESRRGKLFTEFDFELSLLCFHTNTLNKGMNMLFPVFNRYLEKRFKS